MEMRELNLPISGDHIAFVRAWLPQTAPRAVVQVLHGMAEHGGRYARLAAALTAEGYAVYAQDHLGHGRSVRAADELGHIADEDGWALALQGVRAVEDEITARHPGVPRYALGHSMGSFLLQDHLVTHGATLAGAILSATSGDLGPLRPIGLALLRLEARLYGPAHRSALAEALTFKDFNRRFRPNRTAFDWLSRDTAEVDRYMADPLCGFRCSAALWSELMQMGGSLRDPARLARIPKSLPVLLIAGTADPVSRGEKGPSILAQAYRKAGLQDVNVKCYPQGRHELLNDLCRDEVTADLLGWLRSRTGG